MNLPKTTKTAIALGLATVFVAGCGQEEAPEVTESVPEAASTAPTSESIVSPTADVVVEPEAGVAAESGINTNEEYGTGVNNAYPSAGNVTAERSGPPAGEVPPPHTTTDMLSLSPAPVGRETTPELNPDGMDNARAPVTSGEDLSGATTSEALEPQDQLETTGASSPEEGTR
jgi:hypothetical protein